MPESSTASIDGTGSIGGSQATRMVLQWLKAGYADFRARPLLAIGYGLGFFVLSWGVIAFLWLTGLEWMLLPATAGALLVGPVVAVGLYQISRQIEDGEASSVAAPGQIALLGGILMILLLTWIRAATIIFALFFGLKPFPGFLETLATLFLTPEGLMLLVVGTIVGGLFAALTFAITVYSLPMLVREEVDAFTAMGRSFVASVKHMAVTIRWGAMVTLLALVGFATGLVGMIVIFPLLGFSTWHAYRGMFGRAGREDGSSTDAA